MEDEERQHLLDEIARRDAIIERQAAEIAVLKQTVDALCRRIFGKSSEQLDPAQLELFEPEKKRPPPIPQTTDRRLAPMSRRLKIPITETSAAANHARHASPSTCPSSSRPSTRPKSWPAPKSGVASARKSANNSTTGAPSSAASDSSVESMSARVTRSPSPSSARFHPHC